jgi:hypothetical protein
MKYLKTKYLNDTIIALAIIIIPFINYTHLWFSNKENKIIFLDHVYDHKYPDNQIFVWTLFNSLSSLLLLLLLFYFTYSFWRYILFPLIILYVVSTYSTFKADTKITDVFFSVDGLLIGICCVALILFFDYIFFRIQRQEVVQIELVDLWSKNNRFNKSTILNEISNLRKNKVKVPSSLYLKKIFHLKNLLKSNLRIGVESPLNSLEPVYSKIEFTIAFILICITALWFFPFKIPEGVTEVHFMGISMGSNGFIDFSMFFWYASRKFIVVVFLAIWYVSCPYWWKFAIISPLGIFLFQFYESFQDVIHLESSGNLRVLPIVILTILIIISISKLVKLETNLLSHYSSLVEEIDDLLIQYVRSNDHSENKGILLALTKIQDTNEGQLKARIEELESLKQYLLNQLEVRL